MADIAGFHFDKSQSGASILATNGPIVIRFDIMPDRIKYSREGSNVTLAWEHMPRIALAAARALRRMNRGDGNHVTGS